MADQQDVIKDVVEVLHDGEKGSANVKESRTRGEFAREFEAAGGREELAR